MTEKGIFFRLARKDDYYEEITEFVESLRKEGRLVKVLKNGLALMWDLMNNKTDVLISLFPWVKDSLCDAGGNDDITSLRLEIAALRKDMHQQQGSGIRDTRDIGLPAMKGLSSAIAAPVATITAAKVASADEIADAFLSFLQ